MSRREFDNLERLCINASEQEAKAVDAERESIRYKQVEYMATKIGQTVRRRHFGRDRLGPLCRRKRECSRRPRACAHLGDDFYTYNQKAYALVGERKKKKFTLGDKVNIKLVAADLTARQLDFELL